jgi:glycine cleavage system H protein
MNIPDTLKYTKSHEWIQIDGNVATIGITDHAQSELGDIVFVELPEVGSDVQADGEFGTIEAVKTVADLYAPITGKVAEINEDLEDAAEIVNEEPYQKGWMVKIEFEGSIDDVDGAANFLNAEEYKAFIAQ